MPDPNTTALLLAPGPSLPRTWHPPPWPSPICYRLALAVNEAILLAPYCSWWVAADASVIRRVRPPRHCWLCTNQRAARETGRRPHRTFESVGLDETSYSAIAALHLAAAQGCTHVVTYGVDLAGDRHHFDHPGDPTAHRCTERRWQHERSMWNHTLDHLALTWDPALVPAQTPPPKT